MKKNVFALLTVLLLMGSVVFAQDGGNPDSLKLVVISAPLQTGLPTQPFTLACSTYVDVGDLSTLQFAFDWDNADLVLDSAKASAAFEAMDIGPFYYLDNSKTVSNDSNIAVCSGTSIFTNWPAAASWSHVATYYFTISNWSAARGTITIDTVEHPAYASSEYIYLPAGGIDYNPIWKGPVVVSTSAIGDGDLGSIPTTFELAQNFPNPFNPSTKIHYALPTKSHVSITVYNLLGQEITSLVNEEKPAGTHNVDWDGRDKSQTDVASGIYFYKLIAGDFVDTKKMMLIK